MSAAVNSIDFLLIHFLRSGRKHCPFKTWVPPAGSLPYHWAHQRPDIPYTARSTAEAPCQPLRSKCNCHYGAFLPLCRSPESLSGGGLIFGYLLCIMILVFWDWLCAWGFLGAGLFSFVGVIVTVILISIFTFGALSILPPDILIICYIWHIIRK